MSGSFHSDILHRTPFPRPVNQRSVCRTKAKEFLIWQGVTIPNPLRLFVILPEKYLTGLLAGGAFAPYELFAAGKSLGEFISLEHFNHWRVEPPFGWRNPKK